MNKYHNPPKKPGLVAREQQLAAVQREASQFAQETSGVGPVTGNVSLRKQLDVAKSALKRQQKLRKTRGY